MGLVRPGAKVEESVSGARVMTWTRLSPDVPMYAVELSEGKDTDEWCGGRAGELDIAERAGTAGCRHIRR